MKIVILAGGYGTRLSEETDVKPKPLVDIAGKPILWHIMKMYSNHGFDEFVICCGYKGEMIKQYFIDYAANTRNIEVDLSSGDINSLSNDSEDWKVTLIDTGDGTLTGGRIKRIQKFVGDQTFGLTYGDGVSDVDLRRVYEFHRSHGKLATVTAVPTPGRFGLLDINEDGRVMRFHEKPEGETGWINGGFFFLEPGIFDYIEGDQTTWEREPLENIASDGQLSAFNHRGFWKPMDTLRDKRELVALAADGSPPWLRVGDRDI